MLTLSITNSLLIELDRHSGIVILATNAVASIDQAMRQRMDLFVSVKPIAQDSERKALLLMLDVVAPENFGGFAGRSVASDYHGAQWVLRLAGDLDGIVAG